MNNVRYIALRFMGSGAVGEESQYTKAVHQMDAAFAHCDEGCGATATLWSLRYDV